MLNKKSLLQSLPIRDGDNTIRPWRRTDLDLLARWPSYPFPNESLNYRFGAMPATERDRHFQEREDNPDRVTFILDHTDHQAIGYLALVEIDWRIPRVGNMAVRIAPDWCDKGIGSRSLKIISDWCFGQGIASVCLDVAASNLRAVRCYEKAGYKVTGEFWQDDEGLNALDIDKPEFDFLRPHVRYNKPLPQLRFYWMESKNQKNSADAILNK